MPAKNMLNSVTTCASPPRKCPTSVCDSRIIRWTTSDDAINSPTSRKNGTASSVSESMPWNSWPTIDCKLICVNAVAVNTPAISTSTAPGLTGHAPARTAWRSFDDLGQVVAVLWAFEAVAPAVDELLDREQRDQHAGRRHDAGVHGQRNQRGHAVAAHVEQR